jgi:hypothetical protein
MTGDAGGAVAIWHDIEPGGLNEFYAWHGEEHMPERVAIPGFLRGRRFAAIDARLGFFNLYETASAGVVSGPDYRRKLDSPTPRTISAVRHFRNVARSLCAVVATTGMSQGGLVATLRYEVEPGRDAVHRDRMIGEIVPRLATAPGVAAVKFLEADRNASGYVNAEQRARGAPNTVPPFVLIVEGWAEERPFLALVRSVITMEACTDLGISSEHALEFFRHQLTTVAPNRA